MRGAGARQILFHTGTVYGCRLWYTLKEIPAMPPTSPARLLADLKGVINDTWGYRTFRPLQEQAMFADLQGQDSVVVMPTGGGKSLCYQAPAVLRGEGHTTVVISPLIALMKDQVDALQACGVP